MFRKAFFPLLLAACFASAFTAQAQPPIPESRTERHNDNVFFFPAGKMDTIEVLDPITEETVMQARILNVMRPITMNGKKIYNNVEVTTPVERRNDIIPFSFEEYVLNKIKQDLATLKDGSYRLHLDNIVVDKHGSVQYYSSELSIKDRTLVSPAPYKEAAYFYTDRALDNDSLANVNRTLAEVMKRPLFVPGRIGNKKVTAIYESYTESFEIVVKNHDVTFIRDKNFPGVKSNM